MSSFYMRKLDIFAYLCTMKTTDIIFGQLNNIPEGVVFDYSELGIPAEMQLAAAKALSRMVAEKKLKKVGKGKFYKPAYSRLGAMMPLIDELTKDLLYKDGKVIGYITGVPIFAQMGLTTQISSKILIGSNTYRRPLVRGGYEISFTRQDNKISEDNIPLLRFLDAIRFVKRIPACTPDNALKILMERISSLDNGKIDALIQLSYSYPASARALFGAILENKGLDALMLKKSLNPLTKYNIGISDYILPNKSNWNII